MALGLRNAMRVIRFGEGMKKAQGDSLVVGKHEGKAHIKVRQPQSWHRGGRALRNTTRDPSPVSGADIDADVMSWKHMTACEARNALQVILSGTKDNPATLTRQLTKGGQRETVTGEKITYNRGTGQVFVDRATQIQGTTTPSTSPKR